MTALPFLLWLDAVVKSMPKGLDRCLIAPGIGGIAHAMLRTGDDKKPFGCSACLVIFIGHLHRHKAVIRSVDKQHRHVAIPQRFRAGCPIGIHVGEEIVKPEVFQMFIGINISFAYVSASFSIVLLISFVMSSK